MLVTVEAYKQHQLQTITMHQKNLRINKSQSAGSREQMAAEHSRQLISPSLNRPQALNVKELVALSAKGYDGAGTSASLQPWEAQ